MKFSTAFVLGGAAVASAAAVPRDNYDTCPVVKKTVTLPDVLKAILPPILLPGWLRDGGSFCGGIGTGLPVWQDRLVSD